jgi:hypothetical protein
MIMKTLAAAAFATAALLAGPALADPQGPGYGDYFDDFILHSIPLDAFSTAVFKPEIEKDHHPGPHAAGKGGDDHDWDKDRPMAVLVSPLGDPDDVGPFDSRAWYNACKDEIDLRTRRRENHNQPEPIVAGKKGGPDHHGKDRNVCALLGIRGDGVVNLGSIIDRLGDDDDHHGKDEPALPKGKINIILGNALHGFIDETNFVLGDFDGNGTLLKIKILEDRDALRLKQLNLLLKANDQLKLRDAVLLEKLQSLTKRVGLLERKLLRIKG